MRGIKRLTPQARTMNHLRRLGFSVGIVERWIAQAGIRKDLFGCIDLVACKPGESVLGVQATVASCLSARLTKAKSIPELGIWLATGARFQVWAWKKVGGRWFPKIVQVNAGETVALASPPRKRRSQWQQPALF